MTSNWIFPLLKVMDVLEALSIRYAIRGSLASAIHGIIQSVLDFDILAEVRPAHLQPLRESLEPEFYIEFETTKDETGQSALTLVHYLSILKIRILIPADGALDKAQLNRSMEKMIAANPERRAWFATAEDSILSRLQSYEAARRNSETTWREALGMILVQSDNLDWNYLERTAELLRLSSALETARESLYTRS